MVLDFLYNEKALLDSSKVLFYFSGLVDSLELRLYRLSVIKGLGFIGGMSGRGFPAVQLMVASASSGFQA